MRRLATTVVFFANGALFAGVLPHLPAIKAGAGLDDVGVGIAVAAASAGALGAGPFAGYLTRRVGSGPLSAVCTLVYCAVLWLPGAAPSLLVLAAVFAVFGVLDAVTDVAMNTSALSVQEDTGRPLVNSFHAWWGVGAVASSGAASLLIGNGWSTAASLAVTGAVIAVAVAVVTPRLWRERASHPPTPETPVPAPRARRSGWWVLPVVVILAAVAEDVPQTWSAVYVGDSLGGSPGLAAGAYVAFVAGLTAGRLTGDALIGRFGARTVLRAQSLTVAVALSAAAVTSDPALAVVAFAAVGLGVSGLYPAVIAAAGNQGAGQAAGTLAYLTWLARVGFLIAPPVVGAISAAFSLQWGLVLGAVAGLALLALTGPLHRRT